LVRGTATLERLFQALSFSLPPPPSKKALALSGHESLALAEERSVCAAETAYFALGVRVLYIT